MTGPTERDVATNRRLWDELADIHVRSDFYDVDGFLAGECSLRSIELDEVGEVAGKRLLHVMCHIGIDTLSWARRGAQATGIDLSPRSIQIAEQLAADSGIKARFVCSDVSTLTDVLDETFDVVFASYGVLPWIPDLHAFASVVATLTRPGGVCYVIDTHPLAGALTERDGVLHVGRAAYFAREPDRRTSRSYAEPRISLRNPTRVHWPHTLADFVTALIEAGLQIDYLHEHPVAAHQIYPSMAQRPDGWWELPDPTRLPLLFSLRARRADLARTRRHLDL